MITFNDKQVLVTGVRAQYAQIHFAQALGTSAVVEIADLRSTTIQELEDVLLNAPQVDVSGQEVLEAESDGQLEEDRERNEDSPRDTDLQDYWDAQSDRLAMFRAEY
jgi:hypothetical protein